MASWLVVPCPGSRTEELARLLLALNHDLYRTVIVTTAADPVIPIALADAAGQRQLFGRIVTRYSGATLFGEWVNHALDEVSRDDPGAEVMVCGSSLTGTPGAVDRCAEGLRRHRLVMAGPDFHRRVGSGEALTWTANDKRDPYNRVSGHCFMIAAEHGLRCDPQFRWWYSDDDLEMQARQIGRVGVLGGIGIEHETAHALTAEQAQWAAEDALKFEAKWGVPG